MVSSFYDKLPYPLVLGISTCCPVLSRCPHPLCQKIPLLKGEQEKGVNIPSSEVGPPVLAAYTDYRCCFGEET